MGLFSNSFEVDWDLPIQEFMQRVLDSQASQLYAKLKRKKETEQSLSLLAETGHDELLAATVRVLALHAGFALHEESGDFSKRQFVKREEQVLKFCLGLRADYVMKAMMLACLIQDPDFFVGKSEIQEIVAELKAKHQAGISILI